MCYRKTKLNLPAGCLVTIDTPPTVPRLHQRVRHHVGAPTAGADAEHRLGEVLVIRAPVGLLWCHAPPVPIAPHRAPCVLVCHQEARLTHHTTAFRPRRVGARCPLSTTRSRSTSPRIRALAV